MAQPSFCLSYDLSTIRPPKHLNTKIAKIFEKVFQYKKKTRFEATQFFR